MARRVKSKPTNPQSTWLWWRVNFGVGGPRIGQHDRGELSPHLLNLRASLVAQEPKLHQSAPVRKDVGQAIDFSHHAGVADFLPPTLGRLLRRWPLVAKLSIVGCLDILWFLAGISFSVVTYGYIMLARELVAIKRAVADDVTGFARAVRLVFAFPFRLAMPVQVEPARGGLVRAYSIRSAGWFAIIAALVVIPVKGIATLNDAGLRRGAALAEASAAVQNLVRGGDQFADGNTEMAAHSFAQASNRFSQAQAALGNFSDNLRAIMGAVPGAPARVSAASQLLEASRDLSAAAARAALAWQVVEGEGDVSKQLAAMEAGAVEVQPRLRAAIERLRSVDAALLPGDIQPQLLDLQRQLNAIDDLLSTAFELPTLVRQLTGTGSTRRYLVLFQNSSELRPTGGFAGSLAFIEVEDGRVTKLNIPGGGPYDFQGGLSRVIAPPDPIRISRSTWQLQDAAWFLDFPTSARKVLWFLRESGGPPVDGVIAITVDVAAELVRLTGPLELPQYNKRLTAENFVRETQEAVELEFDTKLNRPKQFIADLAPVLLDRVLALSGSARLELIAVVEQGLRQRGLQLYLTDPEAQAKIRSFGWAGEIKPSAFDYLAVVRSNIGGGKTDAVTDERIKHEVEVLPSGELIANVSLTRKHRGDPKDLFEWRRNQSFVRFYVPLGAQLITGTGFTEPPAAYYRAVPESAETDHDLAAIEKGATIDVATGIRVAMENGKTVFGHWLNVMPGEERTATISYRLPFTLTPSGRMQDLGRYAVYFQRQAGVRPLEFSSSVKLPVGWRVRWQESSAQLTVSQGYVFVSSDWQQDINYGVVVERSREQGSGT